MKAAARIGDWLKRRLGAAAPAEPARADPRRWDSPFETLREKWVEVPVSRYGRVRTAELAGLPDSELLALWQASRADLTAGVQFGHRGWYHLLYREFMRGKKVLDVGSGLAIDSVTFAQYGAGMTFLDLAESNLAVVRRVCSQLGLTQVRFVLLQDLASLDALDTDYDVIMAMGSLHHAPQSIIRPEVERLLRHLKVGGRWLQLAYPESRWIREGRRPFDQWGGSTDGDNTPWAEWYDLPKLLALLAPASFEVVLCQEFNNGNFIWFDLLKTGSGAE
jgi:SAM-dependent methyltransferase